MHAEKLMLETDDQGYITGLPVLPPHTRVEVILLFAQPEVTVPAKRKPPLELVGQIQIYGDLLTPVCQEEDWDVLL